jgi:hypothetical protein
LAIIIISVKKFDNKLKKDIDSQNRESILVTSCLCEAAWAHVELMRIKSIHRGERGKSVGGWPPRVYAFAIDCTKEPEACSVLLLAVLEPIGARAI